VQPDPGLRAAVATGSGTGRSPVAHAQQHHADCYHRRTDCDRQVIQEHLVSSSRQRAQHPAEVDLLPPSRRRRDPGRLLQQPLPVTEGPSVRRTVPAPRAHGPAPAGTPESGPPPADPLRPLRIDRLAACPEHRTHPNAANRRRPPDRTAWSLRDRRGRPAAGSTGLRLPPGWCGVALRRRGEPTALKAGGHRPTRTREGGRDREVSDDQHHQEHHHRGAACAAWASGRGAVQHPCASVMKVRVSPQAASANNCERDRQEVRHEFGAIKAGVQGLGVALLGASSAATSGPDLVVPAAQVVTSRRPCAPTARSPRDLSRQVLPIAPCVLSSLYVIGPLQIERLFRLNR